MPGYGPDEADIVIVGEAPGETEILLKRPFSGKSGRLLDGILSAISLKREDVYVANAVSCHPAKNATPSASAIKACQARLFEEIRVRGPKVVVCMGNSALSAFGVPEKISGCRGRERWISVEDLRAALHKGRRKRDLAELHFDEEWRNGGFYLLPTFHPAFALRNPDVYPDICKDLGRIGELLGQSPGEKRELPAVEVIVPETVNQCLQWLDVVARQKVVACDIESTSKNVMRDRLLTLAYAWREGQTLRALVIPAEMAKTALVRRRLGALHASPIRQVWWNGKFDRKWYRHHLGVEVRIDGDGMLAHVSIDSRQRIHGLKERASDDLGAPDYEAEIKSYVGRGKDVDYGKIPFDKLVEYTAQDVGMTLMLVEQYEAELKEEPESEWVYRNILLPAAEVLSDVEYTGAAVDVTHLRSLDAEFTELLGGYEREMQQLAGHPFAVSSYPQLVQVLYGDAVRAQFPSADKKTARGLPSLNLPLQLNEQDTPATSKDACDKLLQRKDLDARQHRFVELLRGQRLDAQIHRVFIRALPGKVDEDGRARTNYNLHTVRSGRLSSSDPFNMQNIPTRRPEGKRIKNGFVSAPGHVLVEADLSQAELRVAAFLSREPSLIRAYQEGRDFHHEVAVRILGDEQLAKDLRPYIKTFNFAALYGAEPAMLAILLNDTALAVEAETKQPQLRWTEERVRELYDEFWVQFPVLAEWFREQRKLARSRGWVVSHFGRKRHWPLITRENVRDVEKEAGNHPIQSTAADCLTLGMIEVHRWLKTRPYARIIATVHDSLLLEARQGHELEVAKQVCAILEGIPPKYGIDVPMLAEPKFGRAWGSLVELKDYSADGTLSQSVYKELPDGRISNAA